MYTLVHEHVQGYMYVFINIFKNLSRYLCRQAFMNMNICVCIFGHTYACRQTCMMYVWKYVWRHAYMYLLCMETYISTEPFQVRMKWG